MPKRPALSDRIDLLDKKLDDLSDLFRTRITAIKKDVSRLQERQEQLQYSVNSISTDLVDAIKSMNENNVQIMRDLISRPAPKIAPAKPSKPPRNGNESYGKIIFRALANFISGNPRLAFFLILILFSAFGSTVVAMVPQFADSFSPVLKLLFP